MNNNEIKKYLVVLKSMGFNPKTPKRIADIKAAKEILCCKGGYKYNEYMRGFTNGLIHANAVLQGIEPEFFDSPKSASGRIPTKGAPQSPPSKTAV